jgi:hypothetical protein
MERFRIAAVIWPDKVPFQYLLRTLLSTFARGGTRQIAVVVEEGVDPDSNRQALNDAIKCFEDKPDLRFVFGGDPSFFFATEVGASELSIICKDGPPANIRDVIDMCLRFYPDGNGRMYVRRPIGMGMLINSARFRKLTSREQFEKERRTKDELHAVIERVRRESPGKAERLLQALGEAAWRANRTEDEDWQLAWVTEALEDDRLGR